jgi:hypothetical protein
VVGFDELGDPATDERRFLASATAPEVEADGLETWPALVVVVPVGLEVVLDDKDDLTTAFGLVELTEVAGFRAVVVVVAELALALFSAKVSGLLAA